MPSLSASRPIAERRASLYGPDRLKEITAIKNVLTSTNVLKSGEYNFIEAREKDGIWRSSNARDFSRKTKLPAIKGTMTEAERLPRNAVAAYQNDVHFINTTNDIIPKDSYNISATHLDFSAKKSKKPLVVKEEKTVRWPDMAPQFQTNRTLGDSEYTMTFQEKVLPIKRPIFPLVDTTKLLAPMDLDKKRLNKQVHINIGTDPTTSYKSEAVRAYTRSAPNPSRSDDPFMLGPMMEEAKKVTKSMRDLDIASHVFKDGDYNNMIQGTASIAMLDYGRATHIPSSQGAPQSMARASNNMRRPGLDADMQEQLYNQEEEDIQAGITNKMPGIINHSLHAQVPACLQDGRWVRKEGKSAHFEFGSDGPQIGSVYTEDFLPSQIKERIKHETAPRDSQVMANDPLQQRPTLTTSANEFALGTYDMAVSVNEGQLHAALRNMHPKSKNHFDFSYDPDIHRTDRQKSIFHNDFVPAPSAFKYTPAQREPRPLYNHLETEVALSHPVPKFKTTSNQYQFIGSFMDAQRSKWRRLMKDEVTKSRQKFGLDTHFDIGYAVQRHDTTHEETFQGRAKSDLLIPAAGVSDGVPSSSKKFKHLKHSENTKDLTPDYTFVYKQDKPLSQEKREAASLPALPIFTASIMKNDYQPLIHRGMTSTQLNMVKQDAKLSARPVARSHLFHTDISGCNNMRSTQMADYIEPEIMAGPTTVIDAI